MIKRVGILSLGELGLVQLGASLRKLRDGRCMSGKTMGERVHLSQSSISKIENGQVRPAIADIERILEAVEADEWERQDVHNQLELLGLPSGDLRRLRRGGLEWHQAQILKGERELGCRIFRAFNLAGLSAYIQTEAYVRAIFQELSGREDEVENAVRYRLQRQQKLWEKGRQFHFVIHEISLRSIHGSREVRLAQIDRIRTLSRTAANIRVSIIDCNVPLPPMTGVSFLIFDIEAVSFETLTTMEEITDRDSVRSYLDHFTELESIAKTGPEADELYERAVCGI